MLDHVIIIKDDQAGHDRQHGQGEHSPPNISMSKSQDKFINQLQNLFFFFL
jgi:hypothetical protein